MTASWMEYVFINILNQSISASWLILAVIVIRKCMKKTPKSLRYVLWALVAVRLLCPISIESSWSLVPKIEISTKEDTADGYFDSIVLEDNENLVKYVGQEVSGELNEYAQYIEVENQNETDKIAEILSEEMVNMADRYTSEGSLSVQAFLTIGSWIWMIGIVGISLRSAVSIFRLKKKVGASLQLGEQIWICDDIQSPFILGVIFPRIYIPSFITEEQISCILAHENEHLKYRDHWWKPIGFVILTLHWFNPLVWIAYTLFCCDMELACDERVIQHMNEEEKKQYSKSLLLCNNPRHLISVCPVAFGEIGVKERIKNILDYKKPSIWMVGIGVVVCIIFAVCFMTNPKKSESEGTVNREITINSKEISEEESVQATSDLEGEVYTSMLDAQNGYILRCSTPAAGMMTKILCKTSDGGKTWNPQTVSIPESQYRYINGLRIEDDILYIEVVSDADAFYYSYTTDDMGETWKR